MTTEPTTTTPAATEPAPAAPGTRPEDVTITRGGEGPHYPQAETHAWQEFAGLAIELGGYGDLTAINPWNGDRLHLMWALGKSMEPGGVGFYDGLRRLVDAMERAEFLGTDADDPDPQV